MNLRDQDFRRLRSIVPPPINCSASDQFFRIRSIVPPPMGCAESRPQPGTRREKNANQRWSARSRGEARQIIVAVDEGADLDQQLRERRRRRKQLLRRISLYTATPSPQFRQRQRHQKHQHVTWNLHCDPSDTSLSSSDSSSDTPPLPHLPPLPMRELLAHRRLALRRLVGAAEDLNEQADQWRCSIVSQKQSVDSEKSGK